MRYIISLVCKWRIRDKLFLFMYSKPQIFLIPRNHNKHDFEISKICTGILQQFNK